VIVSKSLLFFRSKIRIYFMKRFVFCFVHFSLRKSFFFLEKRHSILEDMMIIFSDLWNISIFKAGIFVFPHIGKDHWLLCHSVEKKIIKYSFTWKINHHLSFFCSTKLSRLNSKLKNNVFYGFNLKQIWNATIPIWMIEL